MSISIVIPSLGRPQLAMMINSIYPQMIEGDTITVVADGDDALDRVVDVFDVLLENPDFKSVDAWACAVTNPDSHYGNAQRNFGVQVASDREKTNQVVWFCDDDDIVLPGAMAAIRSAFEADPDSPKMFRMNHCGAEIWQQRDVVREGNVAGPICVCPLVPDLPRFPVPSTIKPPLSDLEWVRLVKEWRPIQFMDAVIYKCEKHGKGEL